MLERKEIETLLAPLSIELQEVRSNNNKETKNLCREIKGRKFEVFVQKLLRTYENIKTVDFLDSRSTLDVLVEASQSFWQDVIGKLEIKMKKKYQNKKAINFM